MTDLNLDEPFDGAAEGLDIPDEMDLAQDREDRQAGESRTESAEADDLTDEKFAYTLPDGEEIEGTIAEIAEAVAAKQVEAKVAEKLAEAKPEEPAKAAEAPVEDAGEGFVPVTWDTVGPELTEMLEDGRNAEIGPSLQGLITREVATSPVIAQTVAKFVMHLLDQREQGIKQETSFKEYVGDDIPAAEVKTFMTDNPWAKTKEMAVLGIKTARLNKEIAELKAGKPAAEKAAKAKGSEETIKNLKAKGTLRRVSGSGGRAAAPGGGEKGKPLTENQLLSKQVARITAMRQGR